MKHVYCEPFCIEEGYPFDIHHVSYEENEPYSCFMHFHEVHEFIIFDEIEGSYFYSQGQSKLHANDIVFTPAMEAHDFEASHKAKSWHIVQVLPEFFQKHGLSHCEAFFKQGLHLRLPEKEMANIKQQLAWLKQSYQQDPLSEKSVTLLKLFIIWIAEHAIAVNTRNVVTLKQASGFDKLQPVISAFREESVVDLTMVEAAALCHMSPSHFSRQFKKIFRYSFSEYLLRHKLYIAARVLSRANTSITDISYDLNFSSPSHFIAQFKRQFHCTPLQYQKNLFERAG